ncbi:MAG: RNA polymerase sigma factor RpoH [Betaproteobacteria bacterium]|nr:RNA polymerase sigma factor RpoH [Betaproteobacteria bacterium]MDH5221804.1 RNA polymerase sigma factor RpoH [Betaproteobacteria bacterium]MDH5349216.1 RNA polymerase sigma factor RpoH [Betaproteobacteria bacterium]
MQALSSLPMPMALPMAAGSLESYIQTVNRFPMLTAEQEVDYARRYRQDGDVEAARQLVLSHLRLVVAVARGYLGYGLPHADLIQEGNIGLMKAVKRFDPARGVRLVSFAIHWVRAEMHEYILRNWRLVKVATTKAQRKLFFNLRSLKKGLAPLSAAQVRDVAQALNVKPEEVVEMETRLAGREVAFEGDDDEDSYAPVHYLADPGAEPSEQLEAAEGESLRTESIARALAALDPRSRRIVEARWLREKDCATLHDLAAEFGVSAERIRQIEAKAMLKMKKALQAPQARRALPAPEAA